MSKPQESPFLDLFYHCFTCPKLFSCFFICDFFSSTPAYDSPQPAHLRRQQSSLILLSQAPTFRAVQPYRHYQGVIEFYLCSNRDALLSPHFSESPECCTCQTYSLLDIFITSSFLQYQPS